jgi:hypothetical protein
MIPHNASYCTRVPSVLGSAQDASHNTAKHHHMVEEKHAWAQGLADEDMETHCLET